MSYQMAYIGCRTTRERRARGKGISVYRVSDNGVWEQVQMIGGVRNPSFLCVHPDGSALYAVHGDFSEVSGWAIGVDGLLTQTAEQQTCGSNPVHLAVSPSGRWLLVANYATGNVVSLRLGADGALGRVAGCADLPGQPGPHPEQGGAHPHQICFDPTDQWALVPDKGLDQVFALRLHEDTGRLEVIGSSPMPKGSGPRHLVFHPDVPLAYVVGELNRTVITCHFHSPSGNLKPLVSHSTLPEGVSSGTAAGIVMAPHGQALFVSNRGHNSVCAFDLDRAGLPHTPHWTSTGGRTPRFIGLNGTREQLLIANEDSDLIELMPLASPAEFTTSLISTGSPVCIAIGATPTS